MMTENLAEMLSSYKKSSDDETEDVKETMAEETTTDPTDVKIPIEAAVIEDPTESIINPVNIIPFTEWVEKNNTNLGPTSDITRVKIAVTDVDASTSIGFKAPNLKGEKDADDKIKKDLFFIKDINLELRKGEVLGIAGLQG